MQLQKRKTIGWFYGQEDNKIMLDKFVCTVNSLVKTDTFGSEQDDRRIESQISVVKKDRDKL